MENTSDQGNIDINKLELIQHPSHDRVNDNYWSWQLKNVSDVRYKSYSLDNNAKVYYYSGKKSRPATHV